MSCTLQTLRKKKKISHLNLTFFSAHWPVAGAKIGLPASGTYTPPNPSCKPAQLADTLRGPESCYPTKGWCQSSKPSQASQPRPCISLRPEGGWGTRVLAHLALGLWRVLVSCLLPFLRGCRRGSAGTQPCLSLSPHRVTPYSRGQAVWLMPSLAPLNLLD